MKEQYFSKINKYGIILTYICLLAYFLIYLLQGEISVITIHDNLDSVLLYRKLVKDASLLFNFNNHTLVPQVMNGLKRNCFGVSSFNFLSVLFFIFSAFWAYMINFCLAKIIGFAGIILLFNNYVLNGNKHSKLISWILALSFSLLPFNTNILSISVSGLPLLLYCVLNLFNHKRILFSYLFIIFYPFYSSLVMAGYAVIILFSLITFYFLIIKDNRFKTLFKITLIITVFYIISEINLFNQFLFDKEFVSHRIAGGFENHYNFIVAVYKAILMFLTGHYHSPSAHMFIIIFLIIALLLNVSHIENVKHFLNRYIIYCLTFLVLASLIYSFYNLNSFVFIKEKISLLKAFQFQRFYIISPFVWYLLFGLLIKEFISESSKRSVIIVYSFLILNICFIAYSNQELKQNIYNLLVKHKYTTYREFYSENLFQKIKQKIGLPQEKYRVVSLGLFPAIAQYNGFYTLDSYQVSYESSYKEKFRTIIAKELEKSPKLKSYFDSWGSRCYIFSSELNTNFYVTNIPSINELDINTDVLKEMGCKYIFSAVEIKNASQIKLSFVDRFTDKNSPLIVYLYKLI